MHILTSMDKPERVNRLREHLFLSKVIHGDQLMKLSTLKEAHIYCVIHNISPEPLLERFILRKFNDCSNIEVKVSLGGAKFNFVQIRPSHVCVLTAYHLSRENVEAEGELYIFKVPNSDIKKIIISYGENEHGTITNDTLNDEKSMKEYTIRPTINDECWKALMEFRINEDMYHDEKWE